MSNAINPEFQRIVRQEFTAGKLGVIGLLLVIIYGLAIGTGLINDPDAPNVIFVIGSLLILMVGPITSVNNLVNDINSGTWLFQRMSAYPLLSRALVKSLFSGGSFPLLGIVLCLSSMVIEPVDQLLFLHKFFNILIASFGIHALCNALVLLLAKKQKSINKSLPNTVSVFLGLAVAAPSIGNLSGGVSSELSIFWYGAEIKISYFITISLVIYAAWAFWGFLEGLKSEFLEPSFKWYWHCFVVFNSFFIIGIEPNIKQIEISGFDQTGTYLNMAYLTAITLAAAPVSFQSPEFWRKWMLKPDFHSLPYWVFPFILAIAQSFYLSYLAEPNPLLNKIGDGNLISFPFYLLTMVRDLGIFVACALVLPPGKAELRGLLFFAIFNFLAPITLGFDSVSYFNPMLSQVGKGIVIVEAIVVVVFVFYFAVDKVLKPGNIARA